MRDLFIVLEDNTLLIAPKHVYEFHIDWLRAILADEEKAKSWITNYTRGYLQEYTLHAYKGPDFSQYVNHKGVIVALEHFLLADRVAIGQSYNIPKVIYKRKDYLEQVSCR